MKKSQKVFYLCDGEVENCKKTMCYKNGGVCNHTSNIRHARNFNKKDLPYPVFYENEAVSGNQIQKKYKKIEKEIQSGRMSINEARKKCGLSPIEDGEEYYQSSI